MKTSQRGIDLIKSFEGFSPKAVKLTGEQFYTWGYGHYGSDVPADGVISEARAENLLKQDLQYFENCVNQYVKFKMNQNQFDALVSFTYNCGAGSLKQLVANRTADQVVSHWMAYTNSSSEIFRQGLINRRRKELALFTETKKEEDDEMIEKSKLIVNGKAYEVERILKNDTNYIKIRDVAAAVNMDVGYDPKLKVPTLTSKKSPSKNAMAKTTLHKQ